MKHVIIGTAGHVDHGKTALIRALTGIDTDRLIEEKKRGITIELGFAHIEWPDGTQAGIVDVPGHEKFIRNMLAGAGGIDLAILVVAADEGFMPQTVEHLNILTLLGIHSGLTVITKKDIVEPEWLDMMREEIIEREKGTFLEGKPVLTVSAVTGEGIGELKDELYRLVKNTDEKNARIPFRLPVDRVFSVDGFGTVVTGTLIEGCVSEGDGAVLAPSGTETRIRSVQVHGTGVKTAYAGQRVALNLAGLKKSDVARGDTLAKPDSIRVSRMLDVRLHNLSDSRRVITNDMQVHLFHGTSEMLAKIVLLDCDELETGKSCYAQLRLTEPIASRNGDRFVIRFYSPLETIGGGTVLDDMPVKHKRNRPEVLEALRVRESGSYADRIEQLLGSFGPVPTALGLLAARLDTNEDELRSELRDLVASGRATEPLPGKYVSAAQMDAVSAACRALLEAYHAKNPLHAGMPAAELRQKLFKSMDQISADSLLRALVSEGAVRFEGGRYALTDFSVRFTKRQTAIRDRLLALYEKAGIEPASLDEISALFGANEKNDLKQVLDSVLTSGELVMLSPQIVYSRSAYRIACDAAKKHFSGADTITLAEMRDLLSTSRKYALAVLEYFDKNGITKKEGDFRRLNRGFPAEEAPSDAPG